MVRCPARSSSYARLTVLSLRRGGQVYYWNSITGQTSATPPQLDAPAPTGRADGRQRTISSLMDESIESLVTEREERALDESMPFESSEPDSSDDSLDGEQGGGGAGAAIMAALLATLHIAARTAIIECKVNHDFE